MQWFLYSGLSPTTCLIPTTTIQKHRFHTHFIDEETEFRKSWWLLSSAPAECGVRIEPLPGTSAAASLVSPTWREKSLDVPFYRKAQTRSCQEKNKTNEQTKPPNLSAFSKPDLPNSLTEDNPEVPDPCPISLARWSQLWPIWWHCDPTDTPADTLVHVTCSGLCYKDPIQPLSLVLFGSCWNDLLGSDPTAWKTFHFLIWITKKKNTTCHTTSPVGKAA